MLIELIGIPRRDWVVVLLFEIPGTVLAILVYSLILHAIFRYLLPPAENADRR